MIVFKPTKQFKLKYKGVDFNTLSLVYSIIFDSVYKVKRKRSYVLYLHETKYNYSFYRFQSGRFVRVHVSHIVKNFKKMNSYLLHEFRHFMQDKIFKIPLTKKNYDESTVKSYLGSPVELDADRFEMEMNEKVLKLYNNLITTKKQFYNHSKYKEN
jgi:hypothetical protein